MIRVPKEFWGMIKDTEWAEGLMKKSGLKWDIDKTNGAYYVMAQDLFVWKLEREARNVKNMKVFTTEEWSEKRPTWKCPKCGSTDWDVD